MNFLKKIGVIKLSDGELLEQFAKTGNKEWLGEFFSRYAQWVYGLCLKYLNDSDEAKDAVMTIFEIIMNKAKENIENPSAWIYTIAKNYCFNYLRLERRRTLREMVYGQDSKQENDENNEEIDIKILKLSLEKLNSEQQYCIQLFYLEEKSYEEICQQTGFSYNQVKSYLQNGKRNLKKLMETYYAKQ